MDNCYIGSRIEELLVGEEPTGGAQSRIEYLLSQILKTGIAKILPDVETSEDLPTTDNKPGDIRFVTSEDSFYIWKETDGLGEWKALGASADPSKDIVHIEDDVETVADLPADGIPGEMHYVTFESLFYIWKETDGSGAWTPVGADFDPSEFAHADGTYPQMSVGHATNADYADVSEYSAYAEQLDSTVKVTVSDPFVFRPAGGGADVEGYLGSKAKIAAIYGNTLVWNQMVNRMSISVTGCTVSGSNGSYTLTGKTYTQKYAFSGSIYHPVGVAGHKILISFTVDSIEGNVTSVWYKADSRKAGSVSGSAIPGKTYASIFNDVGDGDIPAFICVGFSVSSEHVDYGDNISYSNLIAVDLTKMFGAGNEPASVEAFRAMFPLSYYAYDAGRLLNFTGTGIKTVGFNALAPDGTARLLGGHEYEIVGTYTALSYSTGETITPVSGIFTPSADGILTVTGAGTDTCVHLVWSGYRNGETAQYRAETKGLPVNVYFPNGMRSAGSARDELRADKAIRRLNVVDLGTLNWGKTTVFNVRNFPAKPKTAGICAEFPVYQSASQRSENYFETRLDGYLYFHFLANSEFAGMTPDQFKARMSGVMFCYETASIVETPINPPLDLTFNSSDYGTEMLLPENTSAPVTSLMHADIKYTQNLVDKVQRSPDNISTVGTAIIKSDGVKQMYIPITEPPEGDGEFVLTRTVTNGASTYSWKEIVNDLTEPTV